MSSFTSWGVPGDLSLKPDITAPGGSIYSINGTHSNGYNLLGGTDQYELMSGTSMSAPQMTGISALVLQSIQDRGISQTGLTDRALAQSLMMSTATPLKDANAKCLLPAAARRWHGEHRCRHIRRLLHSGGRTERR
ncbi:MAG: S8 family serine peptidase [Oscillospiraceae bacterium]